MPSYSVFDSLMVLVDNAGILRIFLWEIASSVGALIS